MRVIIGFVALAGLIPLTAEAATPTYAYASDYSDSLLEVIDWSTNQLVASIPIANAGGQTVTPDGKYVYTTGDPGIEYVVSTATNKVVSQFSIGNDGGTRTNAANPKKPVVYVGTANSILVICAIAHIVLDTINVGPSTLIASPNGAFLYSFGGGPIAVVNTSTNQVVKQINGNFAGFNIAISPDGAYLYVQTYDSQGLTFSMISTATGAIDTIDLGCKGFVPDGWAVSLDGKYVYGSDGTRFEVISTAAKSVVSVNALPADAQGDVTSMAITPDGSKVLATVYPIGVVAISTATDQVEAVIPAKIDNGSLITVVP